MTSDNNIEKAKILLSKNKLEEAKIIYQKILQNEPGNYKAHTNIGAISIKQNKFDDAEKSFKNAINLKPDFEIAFHNLGIVQSKIGKLDAAEKSFKEAISLKKDYVEAYASLGNIYLKQEQLDKAKKFFDKAIEQAPEFAEVHFNLGVTLGKQRKYDQAEISYENAIKFRPKFEDAQFNLKKIRTQNKLLSKIEEKEKNKPNNITTFTQLYKDPFISKREAEKNLIDELYKINSIELDKTRDIRYGNGFCSDYALFENNSMIIKNVEKDLIKIMCQAVGSDIFIIESFFNVLRSGSGLTSHNHINDFDKTENLINIKYSLTYYLTIGDQKCSEPGILKLYDPQIEILPTPGTIIIFPANRQHSVVYNGKIDRVMIGVNFYRL